MREIILLFIFLNKNEASRIKCDEVGQKVCTGEEIEVNEKIYGLENCYKLCDKNEECAFFGYVSDIFQAAMRCGSQCKYNLYDCLLYKADACREIEEDLAINTYEKAACSLAETNREKTCYGLRLYDDSINITTYEENGCWVKTAEDGKCKILNPECVVTDCSSNTFNTKIRIDVFTENPEEDWPKLREEFSNQALESCDNKADAFSISYNATSRFIEFSQRTDCSGITAGGELDALFFFFNFDLSVFPDSKHDQKQDAGDGNWELFFHDEPKVNLRLQCAVLDRFSEKSELEKSLNISTFETLRSSPVLPSRQEIIQWSAQMSYSLNAHQVTVPNPQFWPAKLLEIFEQTLRFVLTITWEDKPADSTTTFALENCSIDGKEVMKNGCSLDVTRFHRVLKSSPSRFGAKTLEYKILDKNEGQLESKIECSFVFCLNGAEDPDECEKLLKDCGK